MSDRILRKEARVRGSGSRNVQANEFQIITKRRKSSLRSLQSALINNDDIENLPRLRGRTSTITPAKSVPLAESSTNIKREEVKTESVSSESNDGSLYVTPANQINQSTAYDEIEYPDNDSSNLFVPESAENSKRKPGRPRKIKSNRGRPRKTDSPQVKIRADEGDSVKYTKSLVSKRLRTSKLRRHLESPMEQPVHEHKTESLEPVVSDFQYSQTTSAEPEVPGSPGEIPVPSSPASPFPSSPASKVRRIRSNVKKRQQLLSEQSTIRQSPRLRSQGRAPPTPLSPPVPLSKKRRTEAQKPLMVDIERLTTYKDRDKRTRIHTLDVLKYLVQGFEPHDEPLAGKELILHEAFKLHVNHHLDRLMDAHATINEISQKIVGCQKMKNEVRNSIYELKKKHNEVGSELSKVRQDYNARKRQFEEDKAVKEQLDQLRGFNTSEERKLSVSVHNELRELRKMVDPVAGIYNKLTAVNEKLHQADQAVPN